MHPVDPAIARRSTRLRRAARLARHLGRVYASARLRCPRLAPRARRELAAGFAREMLAALEVRPQVRGWPFFGTIAERFDTLFIVRGSYRDAARMRTEVARALRAGARVVIFPEGTTTDGAALGHFHPALFQSAIDARVPVQPVAIRYRDARGEPSPAPIFVGDTTVLESVRHVIRERSLTVEVTFGPPLSPLGLTRKTLAARARRWIAGQLGVGAVTITRRRFAA